MILLLLIKTVYVKSDDKNFIILSSYVGDILLSSNSKDFISITKEWLSSYFEVKDMGEAECILGVKIQRNHSKKLFAFSQESYINKLLKEFNLFNYKLMDTLIAKGESLNLSMCPKIEEEK